MSKILYIITNKLLNYNKCSSETAQNKLNLYKNSFCFRGASPPKPPPGLCLWTPLEALPSNAHIALRYRARHWRMTTTYFTTTPLRSCIIRLQGNLEGKRKGWTITH